MYLLRTYFVLATGVKAIKSALSWSQYQGLRDMSKSPLTTFPITPLQFPLSSGVRPQSSFGSLSEHFFSQVEWR